MKLKKAKSLSIHIGLFILTLVSTTLAGASHENLYGMESYHFNGLYNELVDGWGVFASGLYYSIPFLLILSFHEFGHYFTAKYYKLKVTLPYYIPLPFVSFIGTMGAVIRLKSPTQTKKQFFDVGIAGPLAGFVVAIGFIWYGFATLPPANSIYKIHPDYEQFGADYDKVVYTKEYQEKYFKLVYEYDLAEYEKLTDEQKEQTDKPVLSQPMILSIGDNLLFMFFKKYIATNPEDVPNEFEIIHNPWLFAGYLALLFTSINLLPIGQLDGGHILYGLVGRRRQRIISPIIFTGFVFYAGLGFINLETYTENELAIGVPIYAFLHYFMYRRVVEGKKLALIIALSIVATQLILNLAFPELEGFSGWFLFAFIISRVLGVRHPGAYIEEKMDRKRKVLGWIALVIFVISFIPKPFIFS